MSLQSNQRLESNFNNACRLINATRKVADSYSEVHFWENPVDDTFNYNLCKELGMPPTPLSVSYICKLVDEWNIHKTLKGLYNGDLTTVFPSRK